MRKIICAGLAVLALNASGHTLTLDKDEDAVELRQAQMHLVGTYFSEMGAMVKGKKPYDAVTFSANADRLVALSGWAHEGFTQKQLTRDSKAKSEIWEKKMDFDHKMKAFHEQALKLQQVAEKRDMDAIKSSFKKAGDTCGSCHKPYKNK
ncbi:MAG: cytochrome c [Endozoicomonadaceae bacterium]|nr:cytochrome c [Endozoicomonadaceae bacterium]